MSSGLGIRSDRLRKLIETAMDQGWQLDKVGNHPAIACPDCGHKERYTASGRMYEHEMKGKITRLRRHGVLFEGRGGKHVA